MSEIDRQAVVNAAIVKAIESGYHFDAPLRGKKEDLERQERFRYDGERPLEQWAALIDLDQQKRLFEKMK